MLFRIINNALINMSGKGGTLSINLEKTGNSILMRISDTGSPVPKNIPEITAMNKHEKNNEESDDTWENITVARHMAVMNNGQFNINSTNGNGAEIEITFQG